MKVRISFFLTIAMMMLMSACAPGKAHRDVDRTLFPVKGIDLSSHNGIVDFGRVKADSVSFVYLKATEGTDFCDAMFARNFDQAKQAGLKVGAYHFFRFDSPGHIQAYHLLNAVNGRDVDLPLAIDVEEWTNDVKMPPEEVASQLESMLNVVASAGYRVIIYTNRKGYERYLKGAFDTTSLWICSFADIPDILDRMAVWQHSHKGMVDGVTGPVDLDTFNGTVEEFEIWSTQ